MGNKETFQLGEGAEVVLKARNGKPLTIEDAVYMLEFVKSAIMRMMEDPEC